MLRSILINLFFLFLGAAGGVVIMALCSVNRCNECAYREVVRKEIYPEMDQETT